MSNLGLPRDLWVGPQLQGWQQPQQQKKEGRLWLRTQKRDKMLFKRTTWIIFKLGLSHIEDK